MKINYCFKSTILFCGLLMNNNLQSQSENYLNEDAKKIIKEGLINQDAYKFLYELTSKVGARVSGSPQAEKAVAWGKSKMEEINSDSVWLENKNIYATNLFKILFK